VSVSFERARDFVYGSGRVLERRLFARLFEGAGRVGVVAAVLAYRNGDGGFGHGLEPDKLAPESQPLDVQIALKTLHDADARETEIGRKACEFLSSVADERAFVPFILPSVRRYPRANHWEEPADETTAAPAIAIAGYLHALGVSHPWLDRVTPNLFAEIERSPLDDAHAIHDALVFVRYAPGGEAIVPRLRDALPKARWYLADPAAETYGLPPTKFPREWFDEALYAAHLDRLESEQQDDGGWPITWEPPGPAAVCAWRAIWTIEALRTLQRNGRLDVSQPPTGV
jgi:hypothetical protein